MEGEHERDGFGHKTVRMSPWLSHLVRQSRGQREGSPATANASAHPPPSENDTPKKPTRRLGTRQGPESEAGQVTHTLAPSPRLLLAPA